jgi:hypothetical protein
MEKSNIIVLILFFMVIFSLGITLYKITKFMPVFDTCKDDLEVFTKCNCVPCTWKNAEEINGANSCLDPILKNNE